MLRGCSTLSVEQMPAYFCWRADRGAADASQLVHEEELLPLLSSLTVFQVPLRNMQRAAPFVDVVQGLRPTK